MKILFTLFLSLLFGVSYGMKSEKKWENIVYNNTPYAITFYIKSCDHTVLLSSQQACSDTFSVNTKPHESIWYTTIYPDLKSPDQTIYTDYYQDALIQFKDNTTVLVSFPKGPTGLSSCQKGSLFVDPIPLFAQFELVEDKEHGINLSCDTSRITTAKEER